MISVHNLSYTYPKGAAPAVRDISFSVERGEIFGFLGPSGAGKSTTQKILTGLLRGFTGGAEVMGQNLKQYNGKYFEKIGISFEFPNLYTKLSGLENLEFFGAMYAGTTEKPEALLEMVGLSEAARQRTEEYSKGMRMRLNFARAFLCKPELVFLDEPTSGQDPNNARKIKDIILAKKQAGTTVFLTTHDMHTAAELCDRVAFIVNGSLALIDSPRSLMLQHGTRTVRVEYQHNGGTEKAEFPLEEIGTNGAFISILQNQKIETIHSLEATLEDIFIKSTGHSLQQMENAQEAKAVMEAHP